ncbi:crossover junction endonuclease EME1-like [Liolophura sinensis]|uniref:crossover junction endonuclease EME1-like n=1 Tax=Liolophura sinensis TaxID=3198878 RepID=UPI0031587854
MSQSEDTEREVFLEEDVVQVSLICPFARQKDIRNDLMVTGCVETTVNNFLDGTFLHSELGANDNDQVYQVSDISNSGFYLSHIRKTPSDTGCSSTDINSDSDWDNPVCLPSAKCSAHEKSGSSCTEINSDDDCVQIVDHTETSLKKPTTVACEATVEMYGGHEISDSSEGDELPSPMESKALSISSGDDLSVEESKPLSSLLSNRNTCIGNSTPKSTIDIIMDTEELPDLDCYEPMDYMDSHAYTDSASVPSSEWSQRSVDTLPCSQASGISISSGNTVAPDGKAKKKRRTPGEIAESKRQTEHRKVQREQEKKEKEERKKREVQVRKAMQEAKKQLRPGDCMKYITVVVDLGVINAGPGAAVLAAFDDSEVKCVAESLAVPNTVIWRRKHLEHRMADDGSFEMIEEEQTEKEVLVVLTKLDFVQLVQNSRQAQQEGFCNEPTLVSHVQHIQQVYDNSRVTLFALGMTQYFREMKNCVQRQHREAVRTAGQEVPNKKRAKQQNKVILSRIEVEEVLVGLQLETGCNYQLIDSSKELADLVKTFTKAVAEAPLKKDRLESAFSFHCEGGTVGKVDKNGTGLLKVWKQQLQQFKTISTEMANAIISAYPSPRLLIEAYQKCSSEREAERLLEDIVVRRGAGALTTNRRIGKELSRRVYQLLNVTDPEFIIT